MVIGISHTRVTEGFASCLLTVQLSSSHSVGSTVHTDFFSVQEIYNIHGL